MRSIPKNGKPHQRKPGRTPFMHCFVLLAIASFMTVNLLYNVKLEEKETQLLDLSSILPPEQQQQQQQQQQPVKTNGNHDKNNPLSEVTTKVSAKAKKVENEASKAISTLSQAIDGDSSDENQDRPRFAYVFLIAGCLPNKPFYKGYIYNVMIAKDLLTKRYNSTADIVVMVRMHTDTTDTTLPPKDEALLRLMGITIKYLPKAIIDNFHTAMMAKFHVLELTEYDRVLYLDADVMPMNNLDYMFHMSIGPNATLQENVALTSNNEPASGGFFMMKPNKEDYIEIRKIIRAGEEMGYDFNETLGWGHVITPPDSWESLQKNGTKWNFYGAFTDQGLIYHFMKYVKKNVSIIKGRTVKTWKADENGIVKMVQEEKDIFGDVKFYGTFTAFMANGQGKTVPYRDFRHFVVNTKPWLKKTAKNPPPIVEDFKNITYPVQLWYHILRELNKEHNLGIDTEHLSMKRPSLGMIPTHYMVMLTNEARKKSTTNVTTIA